MIVLSRGQEAEVRCEYPISVASGRCERHPSSVAGVIQWEKTSILGCMALG